MKKTKIQIQWVTSGCHMWLQFCYLETSANALPSPPSAFIWKIEVFLFEVRQRASAKMKNKEVQTRLRDWKPDQRFSSSCFSQLDNHTRYSILLACVFVMVLCCTIVYCSHNYYHIKVFGKVWADNSDCQWPEAVCSQEAASSLVTVQDNDSRSRTDCWNFRTLECCWNLGTTSDQRFSFGVSNSWYELLVDGSVALAPGAEHHQDQAESTDGSHETLTVY